MAWIDIWADTKGSANCRSCGARISWAEVVKSGRKMPFDGDIVAVRTAHHPETWRAIETVDTSVTKSHFATCKDSDQWRKK